jgi:hypothetical protein
MTGLLSLAPLDLLMELNTYLKLEAALSVTSYQENLHYNLDRPDLEHPGEFMMAANLIPVADYFSFALKTAGHCIVKVNSLKVLGTAWRLYLLSLVIMLFYFFYHNSRTTADADPLAKKRLIIGKNEVFSLKLA